MAASFPQVDVNLGPAEIDVERVVRGDGRTMVLVLQQIDPDWLTSHPDPTAAELAAADRIPFDLTLFDLAATIVTSKTDSTLLYTLDVDHGSDPTIGQLSIVFMVAADEEASSAYWVCKITPTGGGLPLTVALGTVKIIGPHPA